MRSVACPFDLAAGLVKAEREARALAELDLLAVKEEAVRQHMLATSVYERQLSEAARALGPGTEPGLSPALALIATAQAALRQDALWLQTQAEFLAERAERSQGTLQNFAAINQSLCSELTDEGCAALAASKRKLWLVEESLAFRIGQQGAAAGQDGGRSICRPPRAHHTQTLVGQ